jgi:hypothetical protein
LNRFTPLSPAQEVRKQRATRIEPQSKKKAQEIGDDDKSDMRLE